VSGEQILGDDDFVDVGDRSLTFDGSARISATGTLRIVAGDLTLAAGSRFDVEGLELAVGDPALGTGDCTLAGFLRARGSGEIVRIRCQGAAVVSGKLLAQGPHVLFEPTLGQERGGSVDLSGTVLVKGTKDAPRSGVFGIEVDGDVRISGKIVTTGSGPTGRPGGVEIVSQSGNVRVEGKIVAPGKQCGGTLDRCYVAIAALGGTVVLPEKAKIKAKASAGESEVVLESDGDLVLERRSQIDARGKAEGGHIGLFSFVGRVQISGQLLASNLSGGGGGEIGVCADRIRVKELSTFEVGTAKIELRGGPVVMSAGIDLRVARPTRFSTAPRTPEFCSPDVSVNIGVDFDTECSLSSGCIVEDTVCLQPSIFPNFIDSPCP
jgi:hypothetical protein